LLSFEVDPSDQRCDGLLALELLSLSRRLQTGAGAVGARPHRTGTSAKKASLLLAERVFAPI
jgi:hypothetical protein